MTRGGRMPDRASGDDLDIQNAGIFSQANLSKYLHRHIRQHPPLDGILIPFYDSGKTRRTMKSVVELEAVRNEVLRKIGRNMLLYQQVEHMFKYLVANCRIEGYASELMANHKRRVETISKQTLGATVSFCSLCLELRASHNRAFG